MMAPGPGSAKDSFPIDDDLEDLDEFDVAGPEFRSINAAMDQLQLALDRLESRNAGIHEELLELLQSNREIRMSFNEGQDNNQHEHSNNTEPEVPIQETRDEEPPCGKRDFVSGTLDLTAESSNLSVGANDSDGYQSNINESMLLVSLKLEDRSKDNA